MEANLELTIANFVEGCLERGTVEKAMLVQIEIRFAIYEPKEISNRIYPQFLFYRPNNYTKVFFQSSDSPFIMISKKDRWNMVADHDSCWRTDGLHILFDLWLNLRSIMRHKKEEFEKRYNTSVELSEDCAVTEVKMIDIAPLRQRKERLPDYQHKQMKLKDLCDKQYIIVQA